MAELGEQERKRKAKSSAFHNLPKEGACCVATASRQRPHSDCYHQNLPAANQDPFVDKRQWGREGKGNKRRATERMKEDKNAAENKNPSE